MTVPRTDPIIGCPHPWRARPRPPARIPRPARAPASRVAWSLAPQRWHSASASASAASGEPGGPGRFSSRTTIACTAPFSAFPYPATASFTSFGLYCATGIPARAAVASASPLAWPTDIAVRTLTWNRTRSTATADGAELFDQCFELTLEPAEPFGQRRARARCG